MHDQRLADLPLDRVQRVQRRHRLLEDHRDAVAADAPQRLGARRRSARCPGSGCCRRDGWRADRAGAAGSRAPSPTCPSRSRRPAPASRRGARSNETPRTASTASAPPPKRTRRFSTREERVLSRGRGSRSLVARIAWRRRGRSCRATTLDPSTSRRREHLARIERVAHGFADEDQQGQHERDDDEAGEAEPRRLQVVLALLEQLAERRRAGRQAEAEEVERGQGDDRAAGDEGQEGQRRDHRVRQQVAAHDRARRRRRARARRARSRSCARAGTRRARRRPASSS